MQRLNSGRLDDHEHPIVSRTCAISSVNWAEVVQKSIAGGVDVDGLREDVEALGLSILPFTVEEAETAGRLWLQTRSCGLSLGDRALVTGTGGVEGAEHSRSPGRVASFGGKRTVAVAARSGGSGQSGRDKRGVPRWAGSGLRYRSGRPPRQSASNMGSIVPLPCSSCK